MRNVNIFSAYGIDIRDFLTEDGRAAFERFISGGQRIGQAWMNAAPDELYTAITGTLWDPFYRDSAADVIMAMDQMTR